MASVSVCLSVNHGVLRHNRWTWRLEILLAETLLLSNSDRRPQLGQPDLLKPCERHCPSANCFVVWSLLWHGKCLLLGTGLVGFLFNNLELFHRNRCVDFMKKIYQTQPDDIYFWLFDLCQWPSSEACSVLPVFATVVMWRGKKSVVCVPQCVAALIAVHRMPWGLDQLTTVIAVMYKFWLTNIQISSADCLSLWWCLGQLSRPFLQGQ